MLGREPPLRSQEGVAYFLGVIENGFQKRLVGITVVLRADEGPVQVTAQLLDEGVGQIVGQVQQMIVGQVGAILLLQPDLHGEITAIQIDEGIHGRHHKFHRVDPLGNRGEFQHTGCRQQGIGGWHIKHLKSINDGRSRSLVQSQCRHRGMVSSTGLLFFFYMRLTPLFFFFFVGCPTCQSSAAFINRGVPNLPRSSSGRGKIRPPR